MKSMNRIRALLANVQNPSSFQDAFEFSVLLAHGVDFLVLFVLRNVLVLQSRDNKDIEGGGGDGGWGNEKDAHKGRWQRCSTIKTFLLRLAHSHNKS